jgi:hypothetical protein
VIEVDGLHPAVYFVGGTGVEIRNYISVCRNEGWDSNNLDLVWLTASSGRRLSLLTRCDASDMYVDFHRRPVAVVSFAKANVRATPEGPLRDDRVISLTDYCRYKAHYSTRSGSPEKWAARFRSWIGTAECEDHRDPRCLPLHIFTARKSLNLATTEGRKQFNQLHRLTATTRPVRVDGRRLVWDPARPNARRGREPVTVAGLRLEDGVHWDVTHQRSATWRIAGADVAWEVRNYINVYPDGATRIGDRCYLKWGRTDSAQADSADRRRSRKR